MRDEKYAMVEARKRTRRARESMVHSRRIGVESIVLLVDHPYKVGGFVSVHARLPRRVVSNADDLVVDENSAALPVGFKPHVSL